jgi:hypothetical protein
VLAEPIHDRAGIGEYWRTKVVEQRADLEVGLLRLYVDGQHRCRRVGSALRAPRRRLPQADAGAILQSGVTESRTLWEYWASRRLES